MGQSRSCKTSQQIFDQIKNNWIYLNSLISNSAEMVGESQLFMLESGIQLPSSWVATTFSWLGSTWHQSGPPQCRGLFRGVATPALLCHKEPARASKAPRGGFGTQNAPIGGYFACSSLVLYGIRIVGFHARKGPIIGALMP